MTTQSAWTDFISDGASKAISTVVAGGIVTLVSFVAVRAWRLAKNRYALYREARSLLPVSEPPPSKASRAARVRDFILEGPILSIVYIVMVLAPTSRPFKTVIVGFHWFAFFFIAAQVTRARYYEYAKLRIDRRFNLQSEMIEELEKPEAKFADLFNVFRRYHDKDSAPLKDRHFIKRLMWTAFWFWSALYLFIFWIAFR